MPQLPLLSAPEGAIGPANPGHANPTLAPTIKADPNTYAGVGAAGQHLGAAIEGIGDETMALAQKIKRATDLAYITRSETKLQAAAADFQDWTKTNPDPATWQEELDARISDTKNDVLSGAKQLSMMAGKHLVQQLNGWEVMTRKHVQLQATDQNLQIAKASYTDFINQATANDDLPAIEAKVKEAVASGVLHPTAGENVLKKARVQVATNQASAAMEQDPFDATEKLNAKNEDGTYTNFQGLPQPLRVLMLFRTNKLANETRTATVREWGSQIRQAQDGQIPLPDREGIDQEAAHQGIPSKVIDRLFALPKATDPHEFATAYTAISGYDAGKDPTHEHLGELVAQVEGFKGPAKEKLDALLSAKLKPDNTLNKEVVKFGEASMADMFKIGGYGHYQEKVSNPNYKLYGHDGEPAVQTVINPAQKQAAETVWAQNLTLFHDWIKDHPEATHAEAQKFINGLNAQHASTNASRLIIDLGTFGLDRSRFAPEVEKPGSRKNKP